MTVYYCTAKDVADFLGVDLGIGTTPTSDKVESWINMSEDDIDQRTQNSWREQTATEYHDAPLERVWGLGLRIHLKHRKIKTWDTAKDVLEIRYGNTWEVWTTKTQPDYFSLNYEYGILYVNSWWFSSRDLNIKVTYRWGETTVPSDIKEACVKLTAIKMLENEGKWNILPSGGDVVGFRDRIDLWREDVERIIANRSEIVPVGY